MAGTLYIVATPIGNLNDISLRAIDTLKSVETIYCEDTRHTGRLLHHFSIRTPLASLHEHNEAARIAQVLQRLDAGAHLALVSDAGTPLVSDPGFALARAARQAGHTVTPIPGASALIAALSAAGVPSDAFYFGGFLPSKTNQRRTTIESARALPCTLIFYEAPHRLLETLADLAALLPERRITIARELTKLHEEFLAGSAAQLLETLEARAEVRGEIVLLIEKPPDAPARTLDEAIGRMTELAAQGQPPTAAARQAALETGHPKRDIYKGWEAARRR